MEKIIQDMQETIQVYLERADRLSKSKNPEDWSMASIYKNMAYEVRVWLKRLEEEQTKL